jgi:hypothetical protein
MSIARSNIMQTSLERKIRAYLRIRRRTNCTMRCDFAKTANRSGQLERILDQQRLLAARDRACITVGGNQRRHESACERQSIATLLPSA